MTGDAMLMAGACRTGDNFTGMRERERPRPKCAKAKTVDIAEICNFAITQRTQNIFVCVRSAHTHLFHPIRLLNAKHLNIPLMTMFRRTSNENGSKDRSRINVYLWWIYMPHALYSLIKHIK